jgi:hypothetical protein
MLFIYCAKPAAGVPRRWLSKFIYPKRVEINRGKNLLLSRYRLIQLMDNQGFFNFEDDPHLDFCHPRGLPHINSREIYAMANLSQSLLNHGMGHYSNPNEDGLVIYIKQPTQFINLSLGPELENQRDSNYYTKSMLMDATGRVNQNSLNRLRDYFSGQGRGLRFVQYDDNDSNREQKYKSWLENNTIRKIHIIDGLRTPGISTSNLPDAIMQSITGNPAPFELNLKNLQKAIDRAVKQAQAMGYVYAHVKNAVIKKVPMEEGNEVEIFINLELGPHFKIVGHKVVFDPLVPEDIQKFVRRAAAIRFAVDRNFIADDLNEVLRTKGLKCHHIAIKPIGKNKGKLLLFVSINNTIPLTNINVDSNRVNNATVERMMKTWGIEIGANTTDYLDLRNFLRRFGQSNGDQGFQSEMGSNGALKMRCNDGSETNIVGIDPLMQLVACDSDGATCKLLARNYYFLGGRLAFAENFIGGKIDSGMFGDWRNFMDHIRLEGQHKTEGFHRHFRWNEKIHYGFPFLSIANQYIRILRGPPLDKDGLIFHELNKNDLKRQIFNFQCSGGLTGSWSGGELNATVNIDSNQKKRFSELHGAMNSAQLYLQEKNDRKKFSILADKYGTNMAKKFYQNKTKYTKQEKKTIKRMKCEKELLNNIEENYIPPNPYWHPKLVFKIHGRQDFVKTDNFHADFDVSFRSRISDIANGNFMPKSNVKAKFEVTKCGPNIFSGLVIKMLYAFNPQKKRDYLEMDGAIGNLIEWPAKERKDGGRERLAFSDVNINFAFYGNFMRVLGLHVLVSKFVVAELLWGAQVIWAQSSIDGSPSDNFGTAGIYFAFAINLMGSTRLIIYVYFDIFGGFKFSFCFHPISARLAQRTLRTFSSM